MVYSLLIVTKYNLWNNNNIYIHYLHQMYLYLKLCKIIDNYVRLVFSLKILAIPWQQSVQKRID